MVWLNGAVLASGALYIGVCHYADCCAAAAWPGVRRTNSDGKVTVGSASGMVAGLVAVTRIRLWDHCRARTGLSAV